MCTCCQSCRHWNKHEDLTSHVYQNQAHKTTSFPVLLTSTVSSMEFTSVLYVHARFKDLSRTTYVLFLPCFWTSPLLSYDQWLKKLEIVRIWSRFPNRPQRLATSVFASNALIFYRSGRKSTRVRVRKTVRKPGRNAFWTVLAQAFECVVGNVCVCSGMKPKQAISFWHGRHKFYQNWLAFCQTNDCWSRIQIQATKIAESICMAILPLPWLYKYLWHMTCKKPLPHACTVISRHVTCKKHCSEWHWAMPSTVSVFLWEVKKHSWEYMALFRAPRYEPSLVSAGSGRGETARGLQGHSERETLSVGVRCSDWLTVLWAKERLSSKPNACCVLVQPLFCSINHRDPCVSSGENTIIGSQLINNQMT